MNSETRLHGPADATAPAWKYTWSVPALGFVLMAATGAVYVADPALYFKIMTYWMSWPAYQPFLDLGAVRGWARCWHQGFNVYVEVPCEGFSDPNFYTRFNYSPLVLRAWFLSLGPEWTKWLGLSLNAVFLLSLGALPQPPSRLGRRLVLLATFSCLPVFAMERANLDVLIFILALSAGLCLGGRFPLRLLGYSLCLLAGLLKFYPIVLMVQLLRERLFVCVVLAIATAAVTGGLILGWRDELLSALQNLKYVVAASPFGPEIGADNLVHGVLTLIQRWSDKLGLAEPWLNGLPNNMPVRGILVLLLTSGALLVAWRIERRQGFVAALEALPAGAARFLVTGCLLMCGCFFVGLNVPYRGVFLLFVFPAIVMLAQPRATRPWSGVFSATAGTILFVLWAPLIQFLVADLPGAAKLGAVAWLMREAAWWWIATILLAVLVWFARTSQAWLDLLRLAERPAESWLPQRARL